MSAGEEKRSELRLRKYIEVVVEDPLSSLLVRGAVSDLSLAGMRVIVDQYLPVGTKYTFSMKRNPFLRVRGEARWVRAFEANTYHVGIRMFEMNEEDTARLRAFLEMERQRLTTD